MLQGVEVVQAFGLDEFEVLLTIIILHIVPRLEMELLFTAEQLIVVIQGQVVVQLLVQADARLVGPAPRHVLDGVSAAAEHQQRCAPLLDDAHAGAVASDRGVVRAKLVVGEGVGAALEHDSLGAESLTDRTDYLKEEKWGQKEWWMWYLHS